MGKEQIDIAGVELGLYARVKEGVAAFFQEQRDQRLEEAIDAVIFIDRGLLGIGHQQGKEAFQVLRFFQVQAVGMPDEGEQLF